MDPINPEGLSIDDAFDKGLAEVKPDSSPAPTDGSPNGDETPQPKEGEKPAEEPEEIDDDGNPIKPIVPKEPVIDPDAGKYDGEYKKERFDGLMSQWQKDRARLRELEGKSKDATPPAKPAVIAPQEVELPPELQSADTESQEGYKIVMKGVQTSLQKLEQNIMGKVLDVINAPLKKDNETKTVVNSEIEELNVSEGNLFKENVKDILKYASENEYPLGTLKQAFKSWKREQELSGKIKSLTGAKKTVEEIEAEDRKNAIIPKGGKNAGSKIPRFDVERDGNKTIDEAWDEIKTLI